MMTRRVVILTARMGLAAATLGSVGLTACDPGPPMTCDSYRDAELITAATWDGSILEIRVVDSCTKTTYSPCPRWSDVSLHDLVGAELGQIQLIDAGVVIQLRAGVDGGVDGGVPAPHGSFSVRFTMSVADSNSPTPGPCATIDRTFTFAIENGQAVVEEKVASMPFGPGSDVRIAVVPQEGTTVVLQPATRRRGAAKWNVSGGVLATSSEGQASWTLPEEPGVYMAELVMTGGAQGLGRDLLVVEVV